MTRPSPDAFDVLGLPPTFDLARDQIERAYLARAGAVHPDHAGSDSAQAHARSADLNLAVRTLRDPELRAGALLARLGGATKEADRSLPEGFLQSIMQTRLEIEEAIGASGGRERWERWAQQQRAAYVATCSRLFGSLSDPAGEGELREIRRTLNAWRYIERLIEQLDPAYDPARADFRGA